MSLLNNDIILVITQSQVAFQSYLFFLLPSELFKVPYADIWHYSNPCTELKCTYSSRILFSLTNLKRVSFLNNDKLFFKYYFSLPAIRQSLILYRIYVHVTMQLVYLFTFGAHSGDILCKSEKYLG